MNDKPNTTKTSDAESEKSKLLSDVLLLKREEYLPTYAHAVEKILTRIANGEYGVDGRIESVRNISATEDININTAARAVRVLVQMGVVNRVPGQAPNINGEESVKISKNVISAHFRQELEDLLKATLQLKGGREILNQVLDNMNLK